MSPLDFTALFRCLPPSLASLLATPTSVDVSTSLGCHVRQTITSAAPASAPEQPQRAAPASAAAPAPAQPTAPLPQGPGASKLGDGAIRLWAGANPGREQHYWHCPIVSPVISLIETELDAAAAPHFAATIAAAVPLGPAAAAAAASAPGTTQEARVVRRTRCAVKRGNVLPANSRILLDCTHVQAVFAR